MTGLRPILLTVLLAVVAAAGGAWLCAHICCIRVLYLVLGNGVCPASR